MDHEPVLISTIAVALTAAFIGGFVARRVGLPSIVGYIVAGMAVGPFTPGLVADTDIALELAEIGVILLMFGVGIHFSIRDLLAVRSIAIPGAIVQSATATLLGVGIGLALGWGVGGGLVLGLALSVASTVVLLRALMDRGELDTQQGRIAVGWLIVEDLFTVLVLVLLPTIAPLFGGTGGETVGTLEHPLISLLLAVGKAMVFAVLMIVAGTRVVPWILVQVAREGSRELFTLAILAIALGIAYVSSAVFGVSFALGAFLAGLVVSESDMSHQAAADALPLRDAFAVIFFVSVGMLVDPGFLLANPLPIVAVLALIVVAKSAAAFAIVTLLGYTPRIALTISAALAQVGEFSFIVGSLGLSLGLLPETGFQLIVAGALLSIALNPFVFRLIEPFEERLRGNRLLERLAERHAGDLATLDETRESLRNHAIVCGYGRVGRLITPALERRGFRYVVITQQRDEVERLRERGVPAIYGDAAIPEVLEQARIHDARVVVVAVSDAHATRLIADRARELVPAIDLVLRSHGDSEAAHLRALGGRVQVIHGERELAVQMARYTLRRFGVSTAEAEAIAQGLRDRGVGLVSAGGTRRSDRWTGSLVERIRSRGKGDPADD